MRPTDNLDGGVATLHTRVETWECDFNGHWNTRFYARSIEAAAAVAASLDGDAVPHYGSGRLTRHMRFHSELRSGDAVEVRSFQTTDATGAFAIAHLVMEGERIAATALDTDTVYGMLLPAFANSPHFLPRGITGSPLEPWQPSSHDHMIELGPVSAVDLAHDKQLTFAASVAKLSIATQHHAARLGWSQAVTQRTSVGRMLVELRYRSFDASEPGNCVRATSRLLAVQGKSYIGAHLIHSLSGRALALFELCTLAVDMTTRRAVGVPDAFKAAQSPRPQE